MFGYIFYSTVFMMKSFTFMFHLFFRNIKLEHRLFEKYSINMMRSVICGFIAHEAYQKYHYLWMDLCLENKIILHTFEQYHDMFISYFIFDTILLLYQVYLHIEKQVRIDLLFHHILAITALITIDFYKMYGISLLIGLSEGMSFVTGPKLISMHYGNKYITNGFILYRLLYLVCIRMCFIWPSLIYYYYQVTSTCEAYKESCNMLLVFLFIVTILHAEINWLHSGRKELVRI